MSSDCVYPSSMDPSPDTHVIIFTYQLSITAEYNGCGVVILIHKSANARINEQHWQRRNVDSNQ